MAINRVEIKNFLVFEGEFAADFSTGANVIIGGNGTGKTTLLKAMYRLCDNGKNRHTEDYFIAAGRNKSDFHERSFEHIRVQSTIGNEIFRTGVKSLRCSGLGEDEDGGDKKIIVNGDWVLFRPDEYEDDFTKSRSVAHGDLPPELMFKSANYRPTDSIFIPATNLLPNSRGLPEMIDDFEMDFDATQIDILKYARRPITKSLKANCSKVIRTLSNVINGEVVYENDCFYVRKSSGLKVEFALEASGFTRLGLLWKLLRNGLLESGTVLFWDEPENSLNPELVPILVDILLELSRNGVQIFLATHSEILASYFAVNRNKGDSVMFYSLHKDGDQIKADSSDRFDLLVPNSLTLEPVKLYERKLERGPNGDG